MAYRDPFAENKEVYQPNPKSLDGVPDLCMLTYLGEQNILHNLEYRYTKRETSHRCYTSTTSKVLVALNPYERMDDQYTDAKMKAYSEAEINLEGLATDDDLPPHVYTVANSAYRNLLAKNLNQSIIVCGESGSGKTESAKYMMRFLAYTTTSTSLDPSEFAEADSIGKQILDANPILESFGNAKTRINNNSSRFGKFTKMLFLEAKAAGSAVRKKLSGACIDSYLLEKSRVVYQDTGERNYHVFYQLTHNHQQFPELKLGPPSDFWFLNRSGCDTLDDLRFPGKGADAEWLKELLHAFKTLTIPDEQVTQAFGVVAGILHLGNLKFKQKSGEGSDIVNPDTLELAAKLFNVDLAALRNRMETKTMYLPGDKTVIRPLNEEDAMFNRDSVCRGLYNGLFRWIVWRINQQSAGDSEGKGVTWIGILDVFGFEIFENNSFEQFCINFANERLQQYFNDHVLQAEQDLYKREALLWDPINLPNNQDCIDLVTGKPYGILSILDSTCVQPKGDDSVFCSNLFNQFKFHPRLRKPAQRKDATGRQFVNIVGFTIRHYAGEVTYNASNFLIKNSDASEFDTLMIFTSSGNEVTNMALRMNADGTVEKGDMKRSNKRSFLSTGSVFSDQLVSLMTVLSKTQPYFVRCVKPNPEKRPKHFIAEFVRPQLRCGGLIEALRIIKLGFPTRCAYKRVHELFGSILKSKPVTNLNQRDFTQAIMSVLGDKNVKLSLSEYQCGLTMVFFRPGKQTFLTDILDRKAESVTAEQTQKIRALLVRKRLKRGIATGRAWLRTGGLLQEMRFKKAALSMVIIYRVFGKALTQARNVINGKSQEAEEERKKRDMKLQEALRAASELKKVQELQKQQQEELLAAAENTKRMLAAKEQEIEAAKAQAQKFLESLQEAQSKLTESDARIRKLEQNTRSEKDDLSQKILEAQAEARRLEAKLQQLEGQLDNKNTEVQNTNSTVAEKSAQIDSLKRDLAQLKEQHAEEQEANEAAIQAKDKQIAETQAAADQQRADLEGKINERNNQVSSLEDAVRKLEQKSAGLKSEGEDMTRAAQDKYADYQRQLDEKNRRIVALEDEIAALKARLEQVQKQAEDAARAAAEALRVARDEAKDQQRQSDQRLAEKEAEIARLNQELALLGAQSESSLKGKEEALENERSENRERTEQYENQIADSEKVLNGLRRDLALATGRLEAAQAAHADQVKAANSHQAEEQERLQEAQEKNERALRKMEARIAELSSQVAIANSRWEDSKRELGALQGTVEDSRSTMERNLKDKDRQLSEAKTELRRVQARLETLQASSAEQAALLQDQLNDRRNEARDLQSRFEKELWDKNNELGQARSELEQARHRLQNEIDRLNNELRAAREQLEMEKRSVAERQEAAQAELQSRAEELSELKEDYKNEKKDSRAKIEQLETRVGQLEKENEDNKDKLLQSEAKVERAERAVAAAEGAEKAQTSKREGKLQEQLRELEKREQDLENELNSLKDQRSQEQKQLDSDRAALKTKESEWTDLMAKQKAVTDRLEKDFLAHKSRSSVEVEAKIQAFQGQVALLQTMVDDLKAEKKESLAREEGYRQRLKEASDRIGEKSSELKNIEAVSALELEKIRLQLDAARERQLVESMTWREQANVYERNLIAKTTQINDLKADLADALEREAQATTQMKGKNGNMKDEMRRLRELCDKLQMEQKIWSDREVGYESRLAKMSLELVETKASLTTSEHENEARVTELRTEASVARAQLDGEKKATQDLANDFERELAQHKARFNKEIARLTSIQDRDRKQREEAAKSLDDSYKYKLQYLELSQADLREEKNKWQDKEREERKRMVHLTTELREVKSQLRQANDLHEAFKKHVATKDGERKSEQSQWELKKQALQAEHRVALQTLENDAGSRVSKVETELERVRADLNESRREIQRLNEALREANAAHRDYKTSTATRSPFSVIVDTVNSALSPTPAAAPSPAPAPASPAAYTPSPLPSPKPEPVYEPEPERAPEPVYNDPEPVYNEPEPERAAEPEPVYNEPEQPAAQDPVEDVTAMSEAELEAEAARLAAEEAALLAAESALQENSADF